MIRPPGLPARLLARALLLSGLPFALSALGAPCDTRPVEDAAPFLTPPFTAAQLRSGFREGLEIVMHTQSPVTGDFNRLLRVVSVDAQRVTVLETHMAPALRGARPDQSKTISWEEMRDLACFPAANTARERVSVTTTFGEFEGWRYRYVQDDLEVALTYADDLPGPPLISERYAGDLLVSTTKQAARGDRPEVGASLDN